MYWNKLRYYCFTSSVPWDISILMGWHSQRMWRSVSMLPTANQRVKTQRLVFKGQVKLKRVGFFDFSGLKHENYCFGLLNWIVFSDFSLCKKTEKGSQNSSKGSSQLSTRWWFRNIVDFCPFGEIRSKKILARIFFHMGWCFNTTNYLEDHPS